MSNIEASIRADVAQYDTANAERTKAAMQAGEKLSLAKADFEHGDWLPFLGVSASIRARRNVG